MKNLFAPLSKTLAALSLVAAAALPAHAADTTAVPVQEFSVFVDMQTGFAFVRTPFGWRFVRQIDATQLSQLHPSTLVSLIQAGTPLGEVASQAKAGDEQKVF